MSLGMPIPLPTWRKSQDRIAAVRVAAESFLATSTAEIETARAFFTRMDDDLPTRTRDTVRHHARMATLASLEALYEACSLLDDLHMSQNEREEIEPSRTK